MSNDEGQHVKEPYLTWCPKAMAKEGHGGQWWILMLGSSRWCLPYVMVHGIGGLVVGSLCVWTWWLECKAMLGYYDDWMLCARYWASVGWLNAWTSASGLMAITLYVACGHVVWTVMLMRGLEHRPRFPKRVRTCCVGRWRMGKGPMVC